MYSILIAIIYLAFISLGLPDSLFGSAWPVMHMELGFDISNAGIITMIVSASTIVSALFSDKLTKKMGTCLLTTFSVLLTAVSMLLYSLVSDFWLLCVISVPYGLGAGAIDSALNNFVALNLSSRHMNWLHCCWGVGATVSPYLMSLCLTGSGSWRSGYVIVAAIQLVLTLVIFLSLPIWIKFSQRNQNDKTDESSSSEKEKKSLSAVQVMKIPGVPSACFGFLCYCMLETLPLTWASTYFTQVLLMDADKAAGYASLFAIGIASSRVVCGLVSKKIDDRHLIRYGLIIICVSSVLLALSFKNTVLALIAFALIGFGCGPVYPGIVHSAPLIFGREHSGEIIGIELAFAYVGFTFSPFIFGKLSNYITMNALPYVVIFYALICLILTEKLNIFVDKNRKKSEKGDENE